MAIALAKNSSSKFSLSKKLSKTTRRSQRQRRRSNPFGLVYERDDRLGLEEVETDTEYGVSLAMGKTELTVTNQGIGIGLNIAGIGGKVSTENGGTVGIGLGIVGIEYNMEGGGEIDYLFGLYRIIVERVGCTYVKRYYIQGIYTHTEVEEIDGCIPEDPERKALRDKINQPFNDRSKESQAIFTVPEGTYSNGYTEYWNIEYWIYDRDNNATCTTISPLNGKSQKKKLPEFSWDIWTSARRTSPKPIAGRVYEYETEVDGYGNTRARMFVKNTNSRGEATRILVSKGLWGYWFPGGLTEEQRCFQSSSHYQRASEFTLKQLHRRWYKNWSSIDGEQRPSVCHVVPVEWMMRINFLNKDGTGYWSGSGTGRHSQGNLGEPGYFKDPRKKKMKCCFTEQDRKMLKRVYGVTGCKAFPVIHPKTLQGNSNETVELQSLVEQLVWVTQYLDMTLGQWPVTLKIPDIDPTKPGNQESAPIQVPNVSELLAEMYGLSLQEAITRSDKRVEFKSAMEIELVKKALFRLKFDVEAMIDYLGFDDEFEKRKLKLAFNPKDAQNFVENSEEQVRVRVFKPGKKNPTLNSILDKLLVAASHVQKAFGIPLNPLNMAGSLMDFFRGVAGTSESDKIEKLKDLLESGALTDDSIGSTDNPKLRTPNTEESSPS